MIQKHTHEREKQREQTQESLVYSPENEISSCPYCDAPVGDNEAYCEECGSPLHTQICPSCNQLLDPGIDLCEHCHTFVKQNQCTFCGEPMDEESPFCSECGAPAKGITCPNCAHISHTAFCSNCNTPLTDIAIRERERIQRDPIYRQVVEYSAEITQMESELLAIIDADDKSEDIPVQLPEPPIAGGKQPEVPDPQAIEEEKRLQEEKDKAREELEKKIEQKRKELQKVLNEMTPREPLSSQDMRNYYAARKPDISNAVWLCNYNNCYHPNPSHCGKAFMGGEWIVVNDNLNWEAHDGTI